MKAWWRRLVSGACLVILLAGAGASMGVNPQIDAASALSGYSKGQTKDVDTGGQVTGGGTPPVVEHAWVLPDEDSLTAGTQIWPKPSEERTDLYACVVASDPNGRDDLAGVYIDVYHPAAAPECGSQKYQKHGVKLDIVSDKAEIEACKQAALDAKLITQAEYDDIDYNIFQQHGWYMYKVGLQCNFCQPAGDYEARTFAVDQEGGVSIPKSAYFTWVESVVLQIDFYSGVNFGELIPGIEQTVQGDADMATPKAPTVKNEGNVPVEISLNASKMIGDTHQKEIVDYDARFRSEYKTYKALEKVTFSKSLELCTTRKIDFSVLAPLGTPVDDYKGGITIYASKGSYEDPCPSTTTTTSTTSSTSTTSTSTTTTSTTSTTPSTSTTASTSTTTTSTSTSTSTAPTTTSSTTSTSTTTVPTTSTSTTTSSTSTSTTTTSSTSTTTTSTSTTSTSTTTVPTSTTSTTTSTMPSTTSTSTTSSTASTSTTVPSTTTTTPSAPEFGSIGVLAAILFSAPAFAYLAVKRTGE